MNADELASTLEEHGLTATIGLPVEMAVATDTADSVDRMEWVRIQRPGDEGRIPPYEISIENGVPFWPWGNPIRSATEEESEDDPDAIAAQLDRFLRGRTRFRISGG